MDAPPTLPIPKGCSIPIPIGNAVDTVAKIWQETRDEDVARRLIALSEEYAFYFRPHLPKKGPLFNELVEHRVDALLSLILRSVTHGTDASAAARVRAVFDKWGTDPRVRLYVDRWSNALVYPSGWEFTAALMKILDEWPARESREAPRSLSEAHLKQLGQVDNVIASLPKRRLAFELLNEVYAHPTDIQRRLVLADALLDLGDPWGELIAMQCREADGGPPESRPKAKRARETELIRANKNVWLGRLFPYVYEDEVELEHGFPAVVAPIPMPRSMGLVEWSTVRELARKKGYHYGAEVWTLNLIARLPCLRNVQAVMVTSRNRPPPHLPFRNTSLEHLSLRIAAYNAAERTAAIARLRNVRSFPNLKRVDFVDYGLANNIGLFDSIIDLRNSRFGKSIREIGIGESLFSILQRVTERMAQGQALPTFHSLPDLSSFHFEPKTREIWLRIAKSINMRGLAGVFRDAGIKSVRIEAMPAAFSGVESESRAWQKSLGAATKIEITRVAALAN